MQPPMVKSAPAICNVHSGMRTFRDQAVFLLVGRSEGVEVAILLEIFVYKRRRHLLRGEHRFLYAWLGAACLASWRRMRGLRYSRPVYLSTLPCILARISAKVPQRRDQISHAVGRQSPNKWQCRGLILANSRTWSLLQERSSS